MNKIVFFTFAAMTSIVNASTLNCQSVAREGSALASFQYDSRSKSGTGFYDDLDEGQFVTISFARASQDKKTIELNVNEKPISIQVNLPNKTAHAFEQNESNPSEPFETAFICK